MAAFGNFGGGGLRSSAFRHPRRLATGLLAAMLSTRRRRLARRIGPDGLGRALAGFALGGKRFAANIPMGRGIGCSGEIVPLADRSESNSESLQEQTSAGQPVTWSVLR